MKRKHVIVSATLAVGLCGALPFVLWHGSRSDPQVAPTTAPASPGERVVQRKPLTMDELFTEGRAKAGQEESAGGLMTPGPEVGLDDTMAEVLDSDPKLRKFYDLRQKALRTSVEQQAYFEIVSDEKLIAEAREDLLAGAKSAEVDQGEELKRLQRIQYLNSALAWEDNPQRAAALEAVMAVVLAEIPEGAVQAVKGSTLGDKFDLFQILMMSDRAQAEALLAKARGTALEQILRLAWETGSSGQQNKNL